MCTHVHTRLSILLLFVTFFVSIFNFCSIVNVCVCLFFQLVRQLNAAAASSSSMVTVSSGGGGGGTLVALERVGGWAAVSAS